MLKIVVLVVLVALCYGQNMSDTAMTPSPTTSSMMAQSPMTMDTSTNMTTAAPMITAAPMTSDVAPVPTAMSPTPTEMSPTPTAMSPTPSATSPPPIIQYNGMRTYRNETYYQGVYEGIYLRSDVLQARLAHFNCLQRVANGSVINRVDNSYIFSFYLQMPVLHFLNVAYKRRLMEGVATLLGAGTTADNLCIDGYDQNFVGEFEEGVLLRLYESIGQTGTPSRDGEQLRTAFISNLRGNALSTRFEGLQAIDYITDRPPEGEPGFSHPRYNRAAVIGSLRRGGVRVTIRPPIRRCDEIDTSNNYFDGVPSNFSFVCLDKDQQRDLRDSLAENPNPVNFHLEAGDYVFAVIGAIVVAIVVGLVILGFFIHPFFLA